MRFRGRLYRALNPVYAREPLSGRDAQLFGGRFNPKGVPALYTSLSILTAIKEANQVRHLPGTPATQAFARRLADAGFPAMLVRGFAAGAGATDLNMVVWR